MYNYLGSSSTLNRDLEWSILQANCYCGDDWGTNTFQYNQTLGRWQKNAECMILSVLENNFPNTPLGLCNFNPDLPKIPGFILTADRENWLENNLFQFPEEYTETIGRKRRDVENHANLPNTSYPFYIGLHTNDQGQSWTWWYYDNSSFPASYFNWAAGYPKAGDNCAIVDSDDGQHVVWKSKGCDVSSTGLNMGLCQAPACDATELMCCADCYYCQINPNCGIFPKKKQIKKIPKKDKLIKHFRNVNGKLVMVK